MKYIFIILFAFTFLSFSQTQNYKQVKIYVPDQKAVAHLLELGLEFDHAEYTKDNAIIVFISDAEFSILQSSGYNYEILIDDWLEHYNKRQDLPDYEKQEFMESSAREFNVSGFGFGSMGGYYTLAEVILELDSMRMLYPDLITIKQSIGNTVENRPIYFVKISDNPDIDEDEPRVLYTALHHAREPQSMMQMIYFMYYLLENYNTDPAVQYLVNNREMYFIPVFNPDGYEYNRQTNPNGGGNWRKNRRNNGGSFGVDLNRNYGPMAYWNASNGGSSTSPSSDTYRGTAPFSEPENQAIRDFLESRNIKNALNYHTYSNLLIYPYGALSRETPDSLIFREFAADMTAYNGYTMGTDMQTVGYSTRGNSDDYFYDGDVQLNNGKIFAMTPEVGSGADGFWPPQSRIFPLAQENVKPNLYYAWVAGGFVSIINPNYAQQYINPGDAVELSPEFRNKGLSAAYNITAEVTSLSPHVVINNGVTFFDSIQARGTAITSSPMSFTVSSSAPIDTIVKLLVKTRIGNVPMASDTIRFITGIPTYVFIDTLNNPLTKWTVVSTPTSSPKWNATTSSYYSSPASYTDSKDGNYVNSATVTMTLTDPINLSSYTNPKLTFWTKFDIESNWDYGQVRVSTNNGSSWIALQGLYTEPGTGSFQPNGQPVYDGIQTSWVREEISLASYTSGQVKLQFQIRTDGSQVRDGWYVDDIGIVVYSAVPVELTSFNAELTDNKVNLSWATSSEINNHGFEIQKSSDKERGFFTIGFVKGAGTTSENSFYKFTDKTLAAGTSYYRLKQVDLDGSFRYYGPVEIKYSGITDYELSQNYPNPFNPTTVINYAIPQDGEVSLKLFNILGVEIAELVNEYKEAGKHSFEFSVDVLDGKIGSGVYFYTLKSGTYTQTRKMILLR